MQSFTLLLVYFGPPPDHLFPAIGVFDLRQVIVITWFAANLSLPPSIAHFSKGERGFGPVDCPDLRHSARYLSRPNGSWHSRPMKLSIISPTFNEAENVPRLVAEINRSMNGIDYEILIVDDNSPDQTWAKAEELSLQDSKVRVLRRMRNPGLGRAVIDGFRAAEGDAVACIDADLQHDPSILPKMLEELAAGSDVVVGSRYVEGGGTGNWNWLRRLESWIATKLAQVFLGVRLKDPMSGYFLMWRKDFSTVEQELTAEGFKILLEILAKLQPNNVREVPYTFRTRTAGESKLSNAVVFQYLAQLWRLSWLG